MNTVLYCCSSDTTFGFSVFALCLTSQICHCNKDCLKGFQFFSRWYSSLTAFSLLFAGEEHLPNICCNHISLSEYPTRKRITDVLDGKQITTGRAFNKKDASQIAANAAIEKPGI